MRKLKTFWRTFIQSLSNPSYYSDVLKSNFAFSVKYLLTLVFFILFFKSSLFVLSIAPHLPKLPSYVQKAKSIVRNFYPAGLTITIKNGTLRTNVDEPYYIPFPAEFRVSDMSLAIIHTKARIEDARDYRAVFFVTKSAISYPDSDKRGGYKVYYFSDIKDYIQINKGGYDRMAARILPYFDYISVIAYISIFLFMALVPLVGSIFYLLGILMYLLLLSPLFYVVLSLMRVNIKYGPMYRLLMHGITFSLVFDFLKSLFAVNIPYTYTAPFIIWMIIVFNSINKKHVLHTTASSTS